MLLPVLGMRNKVCLILNVILLTLFNLSPPVEVYGQTQAPAKQWDKTYGGSGGDGIATQIQTADGGYLLGGGSSSGISGEKSDTSRGETDYWIVKIDKDGAKQWDKTYGGSSNDYISDILPTADGGFLLGGTSASNVSGDKTAPSKGGADFWIVKIDANGNKEWDKAYGGTYYEGLNAMVATLDGGYILGGSSFSGVSGDKSDPNYDPGTDQDFWIIKISGNGVKQWDESYGFGDYFDDAIISISKTTDGNYLIGGKSEGPATRNFEVIKINDAGTTWSQKHFEAGRWDRFTAMTASSDGGYLLGGYEENILGRFYMYFIIKTDANGNRQWKKSFGRPDADDGEYPPYNSYLSTVIETSDKGYLVAGESDTPNIGDKTEDSRGGFDYWLVKVDSQGNKQWDKTFGGNANENPTTLLETSDKCYLIGGSSGSGSNGDKTQPSRGGSDSWLVKTTADAAPEICSATGTILREFWDNIPGSDIAAIPVNKLPTGSSLLSSFEGPSKTGDNYGSRIRGYICAPVSGAYTFYLSGDNNCALYLSTDDKAANKTLIVSVIGFTNLNQWNKYSSQQSIPVMLQKGKRYYIEALQKETTGGDHVSVGWKLPDGSLERPIGGNRLSPVGVLLDAASVPYRVNVGGKAIAAPGKAWSANIPALPGQLINGENVVSRSFTKRNFTGAPDALFATARWDAGKKGDPLSQEMRWGFDTGYFGNFVVKLYFAETNVNNQATGKRIFDVVINGKKVLTNFDIYATAGTDALVKSFEVTTTNALGISIDFLHVVEHPTVSGIEIISLNPNHVNARLEGAIAANADIEQAGISQAYPNPFRDKLNLVLQNQSKGKLHISLTDAVGREYYQKSVQVTGEESGLEIDLSGITLATGLYFVKLQSEHKPIQVIRVVKQ